MNNMRASSSSRNNKEFELSARIPSKKTRPAQLIKDVKPAPKTTVDLPPSSEKSSCLIVTPSLSNQRSSSKEKEPYPTSFSNLRQTAYLGTTLKPSKLSRVPESPKNRLTTI